MLTTGHQLRAARALVGMEQLELSARCGISVTTIRTMEGRGDGLLTSGLDTIRSVQSALEEVGVEFLNHGNPGVRVRPLRKGDMVRFRPGQLLQASFPNADVGEVVEEAELPANGHRVRVRFESETTDFIELARFVRVWKGLVRAVSTPRHFHEGTGGVAFDVQRDGRRLTVRVSREILNDLSHDNEGSGDGLVAAFERFRPPILAATKRALEQGRDEGGALVLVGGDFPELR